MIKPKELKTKISLTHSLILSHTITHSHTHTLTHSHTLLITCTCCYDQIKGTQDNDFSDSFFDSLSILILPSLMLCVPRSDPRPVTDFFKRRMWTPPDSELTQEEIVIPNLPKEAYLQPNPRGGGFIFSPQMGQYWMDMLDVGCIVRAHEAKKEVIQAPMLPLSVLFAISTNKRNSVVWSHGWSSLLIISQCC